MGKEERRSEGAFAAPAEAKDMQRATTILTLLIRSNSTVHVASGVPSKVKQLCWGEEEQGSAARDAHTWAS